jgi:hypothetical protein
MAIYTDTSPTAKVTKITVSGPPANIRVDDFLTVDFSITFRDAEASRRAQEVINGMGFRESQPPSGEGKEMRGQAMLTRVYDALEALDKAGVLEPGQLGNIYAKLQPIGRKAGGGDVRSV